MYHWRIPLKASSLMIGLGLFGLLLSLALIVTAVAEARQTGLLFEQAQAADESSQGFVPIIVPPAESVGQVAAQTRPGVTTPLATGVGPTSQPLGRQALAVSDPAPTATALPIWIPDRLIIPAIQLDAPVAPTELKRVDIGGTLYPQWLAPDSFMVGWHGTSAPLGVPGNTVLNGHHNVHGEVFGHLVDLQVGDLIEVDSGDKQFAYEIVLKIILPERFKPLAVRWANAQWIGASTDERLTLITCWPYESNTHRLIMVAAPVRLGQIAAKAVTPRLTPHPPLSWKSTPTLPATEVLPEPSATASP